MSKEENTINQSTGKSVTKATVEAVRFNRADDGSLECWCIETKRFDADGNEVDSPNLMNKEAANLDWIKDTARTYDEIIAKAELILVSAWG